MTLIQGPATLSSGRMSAFKVECDALTDDEVEAHCDLLAMALPPFGRLAGVPRGGVRVAHYLSRHLDPSSPTWLVVDDVWTTGGSMARFMAENDIPTHRGAVLFARGPVPSWVTALWTINRRLWDL